MSLAAVARRSGLSEQTLSTIEQGLGNPTVVTLAPLGGALDLPRRFLIEGVRRCTSSDTMKANGWMDPSGRSKCSMRSLAQVASEQYFSGLSARLKIPTSPRRVSPARFTTSTSSPGNYAQDRSPTSRPQRRRLVRSQATFRTGTSSVTSDGPRGDDPPAGGVVEILASVFTRVARSNIPQAPVPATMAALADAGRTVDPVEAVTMNAYGCSLVWGILRPRPERARLLSSSSGAASDCAPAAEKTAGACRTGTGLTAEYQGVPMEINGTANCRRRSRAWPAGGGLR